MLTRRYGAQLCYTPMLSSNAMRQSKTYRKRNMEVCEADRPLIVQVRLQRAWSFPPRVSLRRRSVH